MMQKFFGLIAKMVSKLLIASLVVSCAAIPAGKVKLENYPKSKDFYEDLNLRSEFILEKKTDKYHEFNDVVASDLSKKLKLKESKKATEGSCLVKISTKNEVNEDGFCEPYFAITFFTLFTIPYYCQHIYQANAYLLSYPSQNSLKGKAININPNQIDLISSQIQVVQSKESSTNFLAQKNKIWQQSGQQSGQTQQEKQEKQPGQEKQADKRGGQVRQLQQSRQSQNAIQVEQLQQSRQSQNAIQVGQLQQSRQSQNAIQVEQIQQQSEEFQQVRQLQQPQQNQQFGEFQQAKKSMQLKQAKQSAHNYLLTQNNQKIYEGDYFLNEKGELVHLLKTYKLEDKVHEVWSLLMVLGELALAPTGVLANSTISTPEAAKAKTESTISEALTRSILNDAISFEECRKGPSKIKKDVSGAIPTLKSIDSIKHSPNTR